MTLPSNANLPNYPFPANARTFDFEFIRMMNQCWAAGEGIAPFDNTKDCTITAMGFNKATDLEVTTGSSGLNVSIAIGNAWVQGDSRATQGLYFCYVPAATTVTMTTAHATLPRVDRVVLKVEDADAAGSLTQWSIVKVDGTATAGATLVNLTGAPALPANCLPLAYVLTTAAFAGPYVNATHILDARYFAYRPGRTIGYLQRTTDVTCTAPTVGPVNAVTVTGNGVNRVSVNEWNSGMATSGGASSSMESRLYAGTVAGTQLASGYVSNPAVGYRVQPHAEVEVAAFSGQQVFTHGVVTGAGNMTMYAAATYPASLRVTYI